MKTWIVQDRSIIYYIDDDHDNNVGGDNNDNDAVTNGINDIYMMR